MTIPGRSHALVPLDLAIQVPFGTYGRVAPRSGLAVRNFIDVGAGVIDEDYRVSHVENVVHMPLCLSHLLI